MAIIYTRDFSEDGTRPYLLFGNEELVRPIGIGSNWRVLRLSLVVAIRSEGSTSNLTGCRFWFGLCSGTAFPVTSDNTSNWVGVAPSNSSSGTEGGATYVANSGLPYYQYSGIGYTNTIVKVGSSFSVPGYIPDAHNMVINDVAAAPRKTIYSIQIEKGAQWVVRFASYRPTGAANVTFAKVIAFHEEVGLTHSIDGVAANFEGIGGGTNLTVNEALNGYLDTLNFYWNRSSNPLEIYSIAVSRQA